MAIDLWSKENVAEFKKAIDDFKESMTHCFTEKEQKQNALVLRRRLYDERSVLVNLLLEEDPNKLIEYIKHNNNVIYVLSLVKTSFTGKKEVEVASFRLQEMPGCCGVVISTGAYTHDKYRQRGIGTALNKLRMAIAKATGYSVMLCTAIDDGITEKILDRNGWERLGRFKNRRTDNNISVFSAGLRAGK